MLPSITPSKSPAKSPASRGFTGGHAERVGASAHFEKVPHFGATAAQHLHSTASVAPGSPSAHASQAITAMLKTPAVSAQFAVFASPERKMRIDVQAMLNEIHSRPSMAGMLGTGIVSALSAKTLADTQNSKPLEVRANLDRFIRNKLQVIVAPCTKKTYACTFVSSAEFLGVVLHAS